MNAMKAVVFTKPNDIEVKAFDVPRCGAKEILCESIYSFVSPGTEMRVLSGRQQKSEFPLIPGYSWVGKVVAVGSEVTGWKTGELVSGRGGVSIPGHFSCWGGQAGYHLIDTNNYGTAIKLPAGASAWDYVAVEVGAISWRGVSMAFPSAGETAVVIGQGLIGAFNALWLVKLGVRVIVVDMVSSRLARARKWGVSETVNPKECDARERIMKLCPSGADIVFEASASQAGVELADAVLRRAVTPGTAYPMAQLQMNPHFWPRLVFQASYSHTNDVKPGAFTGGEGTLVLKPQDRTVGDRLEVIERVRRGEMPLADIVSEATPVEEAPEAYFKLRDNPEKYNTMVYQWN